MRVVELSDHPAQMLRQVRQRRATDDQRRQRRVADTVTPYRARADQARRDRDQARAQRRWGAWLGGVVMAWRAQRRLGAAMAKAAAAEAATGTAVRPGTAAMAAPAPTGAGATGAGRNGTGRVTAQRDREEALAAGAQGEQLAADGLGRVLGDEWTLLRGYRNRRGEIDHLLVGPQGLLAIESKHRNATVYCSGDRWMFVKYDSYGNEVDRGEITDRGGRSPSEQLNQPADELERFLRSRGHAVAIGRVVLLTHSRSRVGACKNPTVRVLTSVDEVVSLLRQSPADISAGECEDLRELIIRDHRHHAARRPSRA
jgi:hypothetical protein